MKVNLFISDRLKEVLLEIKDSSTIARFLLKEEHDSDSLRPDFVNYLDISEVDKTKISYLSQDKINKFSPDQDPWEIKKFFARPGAVINKVIKSVSDRELELFNNLYRSVLTRLKFNFEIVKGQLVADYYHAEKYRSQSGSLGNSCMKYDNCQRYLSLYSQNDDVISLLLMLDEDRRIMGRALLWNFDGNKVMDRIYTINDEELSYQFKKWANQNGYIYKFEQRWNNSISFETNGNKVDYLFAIQLKNYQFDRYPYMDTFKFLDKNTGTLYNYINNTNVRTLCAADGGQFDHDALLQDHFTGLFFHRGEMIELKYVDGKLIKYPNRSNIFVHSQTVEWSRINDTYILKKDVIFDEVLDEYLFNAELDHLNDKVQIDRRRKEIEDNRKRRELERLEYEKRKKEMLNNRNLIEPAFNDWVSQYFDNYPSTRSIRVNIDPQDRAERLENVTVDNGYGYYRSVETDRTEVAVETAASAEQSATEESVEINPPREAPVVRTAMDIIRERVRQIDNVELRSIRRTRPTLRSTPPPNPPQESEI